jgi:conjugal transfer pilus assembly protein TraE
MHVQRTIDAAKTLNVRLTLTAVLLGISASANLLLAVALMNAKEIVLTPTLPDRVSLSPGGSIDAGYLEAVSRDVIYTFLNRTPETDRYFERAMEGVLEPATYQKIKAQLVDERQVRETSRTSQAFFPEDFYVDAPRLYAEVRGQLEVSHGSDIVETSRKIYALRFVRRGSSVRLSAIGEIKPEASEGEKHKATVAESGR